MVAGGHLGRGRGDGRRRRPASITPSDAVDLGGGRLDRPRGRGSAPASTVSPETGKFSTARCVCAPQRAAAGTRTSPMVSCSIRYSSCVVGHGPRSTALLHCHTPLVGSGPLPPLLTSTDEKAEYHASYRPPSSTVRRKLRPVIGDDSALEALMSQFPATDGRLRPRRRRTSPPPRNSSAASAPSSRAELRTEIREAARPHHGRHDHGDDRPQRDHRRHPLDHDRQREVGHRSVVASGP